jgi:hypothetical protein
MPDWSHTQKQDRNGVLGNDDQGSELIVDHSEVILRSLTTISNGNRHSATIPGSDEYREMHGYMRVGTNPTGELITSGLP